MPLAPQLAALQADLAALAGAVTYRQLADQLKVAIALANKNGLAIVQISTPVGTSMSFPSINVAVLALEALEKLAGEEAGGMATAKMRLA